MVLIKERIGKLVEDLHELIYPESVNIQNYKMIQTTERFTDIAGLDTGAFGFFQGTDLGRASGILLV